MPRDKEEPPSLHLRIVAKRRLAIDITAIELTAPDGADLPAFTAGAHISVLTPNRLVRKYSLCSDPAERQRYVVAVKREPDGRGGSVSMTDDTAVGQELLVSGPHNDFELARNAASHIFIAGGIGITPIMAMIRQLRANGGRFKLWYCTRTPEHTAFRDALSGPEYRGQVTLHHDGGAPDRALDLWPILERPGGAHVYCCGPRPLMDAVRDMSGHWPSAAVHFEAFTEAETSRPDDRPFRVRLARSGTIVEVPVGTTILEALRAAGHQVPSSCESGTCGTCKTGLLDGMPDHRDLVLSERERDRHIMVCVSRAQSAELVIDR